MTFKFLVIFIILTGTVTLVLSRPGNGDGGQGNGTPEKTGTDTPEKTGDGSKPTTDDGKEKPDDGSKPKTDDGKDQTGDGRKPKTGGGGAQPATGDGGAQPATGGGGGGNGNPLTITISYETQVSCTVDFFRDELTTDVFQKFSKCPVKITFEPCENSHLENGKLVSPDKFGDDILELNRLQACVAQMNKGDDNKIGLFVTCINNAGGAGDKCAQAAGLDFGTIDKCAKGGQGDQYCDAFYKTIEGHNPEYIPSIMFNGKYVDNDDLIAKQDFTKTVCDKLKAQGLQCDACGAS